MNAWLQNRVSLSLALLILLFVGGIGLALLWSNPIFLPWFILLVLALFSLGDERILFFFLGLSLVAGQLFRFSVGSLSFALADSAMVIAVLYYLRRYLFRLMRLSPAHLVPVRNSIFLLILWLGASWVFSLRFFSLGDILPGLLYLLRFGGYLLLIYLLLLRQQEKDQGSFRQLIYLVLWGTVLIGFGQWFFFSDLRLLERAGWDPHLNRLVGSFLDPNLLSGFLILGISAVWSWVPTFLLVLVLVALIASLSRSGWLTLLVFLGGVSLSLRRWGVLLLLALFAAGAYYLPSVRERAADLISFGPTIQARIANMQEGWQLFQQHPFWGVGFNNLRLTREQTESNLIGERSSATLDNSFLLIAATSGFIGLLLYLGFLFSLLYLVFYQNRNWALGWGIIALSCQSFFVNSLFYSPTLLLLALGLAASNEKRT